MNGISNSTQNSALIPEKNFFIQDHADAGPRELPFSSYLQQSIWGVNDSVIEAARGYEEVGFGKGPGLQNVATADYETHFLLYLAAGVASSVTKAAGTLFQMSF